MRFPVLAGRLAPAVLLGLALAWPAPAGAQPRPPQPQVVGGSEAAEGAFPFQVAVIRAGDPGHTFDDDFNQWCGGTVLNRVWALTAWHCVSGLAPRQLEVVAGRTDLAAQDRGQRRTVAEVQLYPLAWKNADGSPHQFARDWALLGLTRPFLLDQPASPDSATVSAVALVGRGDSSWERDGAAATTIGWGITEGQQRSPRLRQAEVPIIADARCPEVMSAQAAAYLAPEVETCAGKPTVAGNPPPGTDSCTYDSGGPLLVTDAQGQRRQAGVVSWGAQNCGQYAGVYASVDDPAFRDWLAPIVARAPAGSPTLARARAFDQAAPDAAGGRLAQTVLNPDGASVSTRYKDPGGWGPWGAPVSLTALGLPAKVTRLRSFSQAGRPPSGQPKQDALSADGLTLWHREFEAGAWGAWQPFSVASIGLPEAGPIRAWELTGPDPAIGASAWKQTALSDDGRRLMYRFHRGGWGGWSLLGVDQIGIAGVGELRSFSQGVNPAGQAKQDALGAEGYWLYSRVFSAGRWGAWQAAGIDALGVPEVAAEAERAGERSDAVHGRPPEEAP